ncbi:shikimate dehydrogenase [Porticoccaceae bacterium LTM1]|nr:shikimate dehydrogenase [Porticoccaceae bacterium LTM1]
MIDRYAVFGNPIAHSKSPQIHRIFAEQTHQSMEYVSQCVPLDDFAQAVEEFMAQGGKGLNITVPFKQEALAVTGQLTERARLAGAVNTLVLSEDGTLLGDTTDGVGMVRDIRQNLQWSIAGRRVLVLGAGGAVRGVLEPLLAERPAELVIANRTVQKAEQLADLFPDMDTISGSGFDALAGAQFDLVINGTSASLSGELPPLPNDLLAAGAHCYDMMYGSKPTPFMSWAQQQGAEACSDGLGMLVEQAAESFYLWRGVRPETAQVIAGIRRQLIG